MMFRIVTRWIAVTDTPEGPQRLTFDRVHYREADTKRAARKEEHAHNRTRLSGSAAAESFAADGWHYRITAARAVSPEARTVVEAREYDAAWRDAEADNAANDRHAADYATH